MIIRQADEKAKSWLDQKITQLSTQFSKQAFYLTFTAASRFLGKTALNITANDLADANELSAGFYPENWTIDRAARVLFILYLPSEKAESHVEILEKLFQTAEMNELVALYSALPLLPFPEKYMKQCEEGIRTNISVVFEAIALNNPFPAKYLSENSWNQLFLKSIFTGRQIGRIQGVRQRANAALSQICSDYAHERWAAGRKVTPELWMPIAGFVNDEILEDLKKLKDSTDILQQQAFVLICLESMNSKAKELVNQLPTLKEQAEKGVFSWESISAQWHEENKS
ncbi:MAG: hypothetical protein EAZ08_07945 [Cytophagales bacterium]|nr:MAG: hypothetical protein EAZ08_07945 [Cytophagales bacterium]